MRVGILGAGLQGACVALELANHGVQVDLYDKSAACMTQASARNEGKVHLGYVYANDPTLNTARTMVKGAVMFETLLRRWLGADLDEVPVSHPFNYVVLGDSMLSTSQVQTHLNAVSKILLEESEGGKLPYFNQDLTKAPVRLSQDELEGVYSTQRVQAAFRTQEIAVDPEALSAVIRRQLMQHPNITCRLSCHVHAVRPSQNGAAVEFEHAGTRHEEGYDHLINALWEGRLAVDQTAGIHAKRSWLYRVKYYFRVPGNAQHIPPSTMVLGPFGDIVPYQDETYLSWYPAGMRGSSTDLLPPAWPGELEGELAAELKAVSIGELAKIAPSIGKIPPEAVAASNVKGGVIFAWGHTDIDDKESELHERHAIGPRSFGRYHSIDTGKLTTAPLFAMQMATRILTGE